ncbi:Beta-1,4 N-acetylgalactosaminyltransferase 2 [Thelohanellus kitauei]|uniref:Beta-1,4 N-acetylgalactosaminyltransferase 2 n=1 Tax=Thelohanellus kitauei TaxID=669202 RepID=A0A0C2J574_THEKT|nr:Beta-1,4 N-acetylgalactosaminyltransferase 2 [Thelohanellus kitauei]
MVKTKYFLLVDDDNFFTEETNIEKLVAILESTDAHFVGGDHTVGYKYCGYFGKLTCLRNQENGKITLIHENGLYFEKIREFDYCYRADIMKNFFVARKDEVLKLGGWSNELLVLEHEDFFIRMLQQDAKSIFCTDIKIGHNQVYDGVRTQRAHMEEAYSKMWMNMNHVNHYDYRPTN